jgi:hypothetical protein
MQSDFDIQMHAIAKVSQFKAVADVNDQSINIRDIKGKNIVSIPISSLEKIIDQAKQRLSPKEYESFTKALVHIDYLSNDNAQLHQVINKVILQWEGGKENRPVRGIAADAQLLMENMHRLASKREAEVSKKSIAVDRGHAKGSEPHSTVKEKTKQLASIKDTGLTKDEAHTLSEYIEGNKEGWLKTAKSNGAPHIIFKRHSKMPRTIQVNPDGSIEILLKRKRIQNLGVGGQSVVTKSIAYKEGAVVARSTTVFKNKEELEQAKNTVRILYKLKDIPGVVQIRSAVFYKSPQKKGGPDVDKLAITMDHYGGGDLKHYLTSQHDVKPKELIIILNDIIHGLRGIHELAGVIHHDLKPGNILLHYDEDKRLRAKIIDLGAAVVNYEGKKDLDIGTESYIAPERYTGGGIGFESDNWSFGVILLQLLTNESPMTINSRLKNMINNLNPSLWDRAGYKIGKKSLLEGQKSLYQNPVPGNELGNVIEGLLTPDPAKRMTLENAAKAINRLEGAGTFAAKLKELRSKS